MRFLLETIFLALFTKIDFNTQVFEDEQAMRFTYQDKNYILTIHEQGE